MLERDKVNVLSRFRAGEIQLLLSVDMLNEGIDVPDVNMVIFLRVTHSRRIFIQQLGRGLRLTPRKESVLILDFVADLRRIAEGLDMNNRDRMARQKKQEVLMYGDGRIIKFSNDKPATFFKEYLSDIARVAGMNENSALNSMDLKFPDKITI